MLPMGKGAVVSDDVALIWILILQILQDGNFLVSHFQTVWVRCDGLNGLQLVCFGVQTFVYRCEVACTQEFNNFVVLSKAAFLFNVHSTADFYVGGHFSLVFPSAAGCYQVRCFCISNTPLVAYLQ